MKSTTNGKVILGAKACEQEEEEEKKEKEEEQKRNGLTGENQSGRKTINDKRSNPPNRCFAIGLSGSNVVD